jgi:hypothetical protein
MVHVPRASLCLSLCWHCPSQCIAVPSESMWVPCAAICRASSRDCGGPWHLHQQYLPRDRRKNAPSPGLCRVRGDHRCASDPSARCPPMSCMVPWAFSSIHSLHFIVLRGHTGHKTVHNLGLTRMLVLTRVLTMWSL